MDVTQAHGTCGSARQGKSYEVLQDSWWEWAKRRADPALQCGKPVAETEREHLSPNSTASAWGGAGPDARRSAAPVDVKRREAELKLSAVIHTGSLRSTGNVRSLAGAACHTAIWRHGHGAPLREGAVR